MRDPKEVEQEENQTQASKGLPMAPARQDLPGLTGLEGQVARWIIEDDEANGEFNDGGMV